MKKKIAESKTNFLDKSIIKTAIKTPLPSEVIINGRTFFEGDMIDDVIIKTIEHEQVSFKVGKVIVMKQVSD